MQRYEYERKFGRRTSIRPFAADAVEQASDYVQITRSSRPLISLIKFFFQDSDLNSTLCYLIPFAVTDVTSRVTIAFVRSTKCLVKQYRQTNAIRMKQFACFLFIRTRHILTDNNLNKNQTQLLLIL